MEEKGGIVTGDSAVKRGTYSTKLRSRQDNGCPSLAHSHTGSTQLYQTPHSFLLPLLCSALSLSFSHVRLSSPHHRGMGDNETPAQPGRSGALFSFSLSLHWLPPLPPPLKALKEEATVCRPLFARLRPLIDARTHQNTPSFKS